MERDVVVRENLNDMVTSIGFKVSKKRWGTSLSCDVKLFNNEVISISGPETKNLFDLLNSYFKCGKTDIVVSKKLVEEVKSTDVDSVDGSAENENKTYICVLYELKNGKKYRLFLSRWEDNDILNNYYELFMKTKTLSKKGN